MSEIRKMYNNVGLDIVACGYDYPAFTAEKQLELIKWLLEKYCDIRIRKNLEGVYYITSFNDISCFSEDFEETLANFTSTHLQDLTEEEKAEIKRILNENH